MSLSAPSTKSINAAALRFGLAAARFNEAMVDGLLERVIAALQAAGVKPSAIQVVRVPGSHEVPWAVHTLARRGRCDCVIALGVLIAGETNHHEMVGETVSHALLRIAIESGVPAINGVIVANSVAQARARCTGKINRGAEFAAAALEMAALRRTLSR